MKASQQEAIIKRKADFITSEHNDTVLNAFLTKHGYIEYYYENPNGYTLFSKYKLKEPAKDYHFPFCRNFLTFLIRTK